MVWFGFSGIYSINPSQIHLVVEAAYLVLLAHRGTKLMLGR